MTEEQKHILIVEDEQQMVNILRNRFELEGFKVTVARDGEDGFAKAQEVRPDLVLTDVLMPKMDGISMAEFIREAPWGKDMPIMFLSNLSKKPTADKNAIENTVDYLIKTDWSLREIIQKVHETLAD